MGLYGYLGIAGILAVMGAFIWGFFYGKKIAKGELEKEYLQGWNDSQKRWDFEKKALYQRLKDKIDALNPTKQGAKIVD